MTTDISVSNLIIEAIRGYVRSPGKSRSRVAVEAGLDNKTLKNVFEEKYDPRLSTVQSIFDIMPKEHINLTPLRESVNKNKMKLKRGKK